MISAWARLRGGMARAGLPLSRFAQARTSQCCAMTGGLLRPPLPRSRGLMMRDTLAKQNGARHWNESNASAPWRNYQGQNRHSRFWDATNIAHWQRKSARDCTNFSGSFAFPVFYLSAEKHNGE